MTVESKRREQALRVAYSASLLRASAAIRLLCFSAESKRCESLPAVAAEVESSGCRQAWPQEPFSESVLLLGTVAYFLLLVLAVAAPVPTGLYMPW